MNKRTRKLKLTALLVVLAAVLSLTALATDATHCAEADCDGTYVNGFCTENDEHFQAPNQTIDTDGKEVYGVGNAGQLYWIAAQTNDMDTPNNFAGCIVRLTADIVVNPGTFDTKGNYTPAATEEASTTPRSWTPIGNAEYIETSERLCEFSGIFDGNKHTVSGLYLISDDDYAYVGLIGGLCATGASNAAVFNVGVVNSYLCSTGNESNIAGIVATVYDNGEDATAFIVNCYNTATLAFNYTGEDYDASANIGGIVGYVDINSSSNSSAEVTFTIFNCYNTGNIVVNSTTSANFFNVGGIIGNVILYNSNSLIRNCYNAGEITVTFLPDATTDKNHIGGICGSYDVNYGTKNSVAITDCFYKSNYDADAEDKFDHNGLYGFGYYNIVPSKITGKNTDCAGNLNYIPKTSFGAQPVDSDTRITYDFYNINTNRIESYDIAFSDGSLAYTMTSFIKEYWNHLETTDKTSPLTALLENQEWYQTLPKDPTPNFTGKGLKLNVDSDQYYNSDTAILPTIKGAQIRSDGKYGLRFGFVYDGSEEAIAEYDDGSISYGALIVPSELRDIVNADGLTDTMRINLKNLDSLKEQGIEVANVVKERDFDDTDPHNIIYTAVVYDIPYIDENDNKYDTLIFAMPYVTYSINGVQYTAYGSSYITSVNLVREKIDGEWFD